MSITLKLPIEKGNMKDKVSEILDKYQTDSILFTNNKEIFYITGAEFDGFWLLFLKNKTYLICQKMIENQVKEYFSKQDIYIKCTDLSFHKTVAEILKQNKINTLLIDLKYMNAANFILINESLNYKKIDVIKKIGILDDIRLVKNINEIKNLKKACQIASEICNTIKYELKPGLSELDIHYRILELFAKNRVLESFSPIVASGVNSANPHHKSSNRKIAKNDIIVIDMGCICNNYCSDLTRTYFLGKPDNSNYKKVWNIVKNSQNVVLKKIKSGLAISWADKTARNIIEAAGYKENFIHTTGHGIGIEIHETPSLALNTKGVFLTDMAVTVEPGIYIEREFGIRIEDTILIKENGCEVLTSAEY
ncbi:MAG: aminopeptidase P family protein [Endomicrobiia bacterium]|nr:MAG: aminopeptidase P family protein [Endomicrobiia bacterium]